MPIYLKTKRCHVALDHQGAAEILWLQIFVVIDDYQEMTRKQGFMIQELIKSMTLGYWCPPAPQEASKGTGLRRSSSWLRGEEWWVMSKPSS